MKESPYKEKYLANFLFRSAAVFIFFMELCSGINSVNFLKKIVK